MSTVWNNITNGADLGWDTDNNDVNAWNLTDEEAEALEIARIFDEELPHPSVNPDWFEVVFTNFAFWLNQWLPVNANVQWQPAPAPVPVPQVTFNLFLGKHHN